MKSTSRLLTQLSVGAAPSLALLAAAGAAWQRAAERRAAALPPPGRLVDVGGRTAHVLDVGEGGPVVVLDSGLSGSNLEWRGIMADLATTTRVVHVDRPGLGYSPEVRGARSAVGSAEELRDALGAVEAPPPYVLVGHSLAGLHLRAFAHRHPEEVAGLVYIDVTHEVAEEVLSLGLVGDVIGRFSPLADALAAVGFKRLLERVGQDPWSRFSRLLPDGPPAEIDPVEARLLYGRRATMRASLAEYAGVRRSIQEVVDLDGEGQLPDVPTVVLSAGRHPERLRQRFEQFIREGHGDLAARSSHARHEVVEGAGHLIPLERPDRVVAAVSEVLRAARGDGAVPVAPRTTA